MAEAPASSIIFAASTATTFSKSQPFRIFTVTGTFEFLTTAFTISFTSSKFNNNLLPSPFFTTFGAGHPIFISIISAMLLTYPAAYSIACMSLPNICIAFGPSCLHTFNNFLVFSSL